VPDAPVCRDPPAVTVIVAVTVTRPPAAVLDELVGDIVLMVCDHCSPEKDTTDSLVAVLVDVVEAALTTVARVVAKGIVKELDDPIALVVQDCDRTRVGAEGVAEMEMEVTGDDNEAEEEGAVDAGPSKMSTCAPGLKPLRRL
jgi:hypothetical protein